MDVLNNYYTCYHQLYRLVPVLFTPVQLCTCLKNFICLVIIACHVGAAATMNKSTVQLMKRAGLHTVDAQLN